jgi:hypothetical protein
LGQTLNGTPLVGIWKIRCSHYARFRFRLPLDGDSAAERFGVSLDDRTLPSPLPFALLRLAIDPFGAATAASPK